ncbi:hypothetical protein NDU88_000657 [Pleurodeles waltl]|uniref:Uncharacterized protein n=1 Tax=Pleurodeles waltl TaxID=8319 RepID=A0AAV7VUS2_PLEWA|nr:hypothetical protein NDU88_000657 [Pleurodeles waltl]
MRSLKPSAPRARRLTDPEVCCAEENAHPVKIPPESGCRAAAKKKLQRHVPRFGLVPTCAFGFSVRRLQPLTLPLMEKVVFEEALLQLNSLASFARATRVTQRLPIAWGGLW